MRCSKQFRIYITCFELFMPTFFICRYHIRQTCLQSLNSNNNNKSLKIRESIGNCVKYSNKIVSTRLYFLVAIKMAVNNISYWHMNDQWKIYFVQYWCWPKLAWSCWNYETRKLICKIVRICLFLNFYTFICRWRCDCHLRSFRMWLIKSNVPLEHGVEPVCQSPRRLLGIRVKSLR